MPGLCVHMYEKMHNHCLLLSLSLSTQKMAGNLEGAGCLSAQSSPVRSEGGVGLEMVEVCMDMLARYTYSNLSTLPSRFVRQSCTCMLNVWLTVQNSIYAKICILHCVKCLPSPCVDSVCTESGVWQKMNSAAWASFFFFLLQINVRLYHCGCCLWQSLSLTFHGLN